MPQDNGRLTAEELRAQYQLGARVRPPDPREWAYRLTPATAVDRTQPRSIGHYAAEVKDQGNEGSCTANAGAGCQETCAAIAGATMPVPPLSREWIYYTERVHEGTFPTDAGAYVADEFDVVLKNGGCPLEADWPYDANPSETPPAGLDAKPKALYITGHQPIAAADFEDGGITALDNKQPISIALDWRGDFDHDFTSTGVLSANPVQPSRGGHNVYAVCYVPAAAGREAMFGGPNSWGANSPARTDLCPDAKPGWVFLPVTLLRNGIVSEMRAAVGKTAPIPPQPGPGPVPSNVKAEAQAVCVATMQSAINAYNAVKANYPYYRGEYDAALADYTAISKL